MFFVYAIVSRFEPSVNRFNLTGSPFHAKKEFFLVKPSYSNWFELTVDSKNERCILKIQFGIFPLIPAERRDDDF